MHNSSVRWYAHMAVDEAARCSAKKFRDWHRLRSAFVALMNGDETLVAAVAFAWGAQLAIVLTHDISKPVAHALAEALPLVPTQTHGYALMCTALVHALGMNLQRRRLRQVCTAAEMVFFIYAWWSLVLSHQYVSHVFIIPLYMVSCMINILSLQYDERRAGAGNG